MPTSFFNELMQSLSDRGRQLLGRARVAVQPGDLAALGEALLSRRGEASGVVIARSLLEGYASAPLALRLRFLTAPADRCGSDSTARERAIDAYRAKPDAKTIAALHEAAEARRQELFRRINL